MQPRNFKIESWQQFARNVRVKGCGLLEKLPDYPQSILVSGVQRSGTTIVARIIRMCPQVAAFPTRHDDELDAALILSGYTQHEPAGRYCFQTTYVNECWAEYFRTCNYKLVWVLRDPISVVNSMLYNWRRFALNELYRTVGKFHDAGVQHGAVRFVSSLRKATFSYLGKARQLDHLIARLPEDRVMVISYEALKKDAAQVLRNLFGFLELPYLVTYASEFHVGSSSRRRAISRKDANFVEEHCGDVYARQLANCLTQRQFFGEM